MKGHPSAKGGGELALNFVALWLAQLNHPVERRTLQE
jgi:hypothetical protein